MALTAGTMLGQYEIRSPLGAGGMGEVYRARDTRLNREVAIKVLPESVTADPERLRRFEQEARAAALNHPNILAVYQMATHDGVSYMVTELLDGETLRERLRRGPIPLRKAIDFGVQIANGLAAAHEKGIVHRDLKPENLFITKDGRVKILDFGLAKVTPAPAASADGRTVTLEETEPGVMMGTVGYMSPEQARGQTADARSDIFSFGTTLYEMVTGRAPFRKPTKADTISAILNEEPPPISQLASEVPPGLQRVVHRCLEKNPEQRFHSAHDLAFALEALSDTAIMSPGGGHPQESGKRNRARMAIASVVAAMLLGTAALAYFLTRPEPVPRVSNYVQLTHDGQQKRLVGSDGARLYLGIGSLGLDTLTSVHGFAEISISGGEPKKISVLPSTNMIPLALSPDGSEFLALDGQFDPPTGPLWSVPVLGGSPRRLGDTAGQSATWSTDGKMLAYSNGSDLSVAKADGSESRKLVTMKAPTYIYNPVWSPDGTHLRFDVQATVNSPPVMWEVSVDGTDIHRLLPGWSKPPNMECCGKWTADGNYFVFRSANQIWALPRKRGFLSPVPKPIQLTSSPLGLSSPLPSKDGKKLFVVGQALRGTLMRYDVKSGHFSPYLGGISAEYIAFSKDGQWVAYVTYPEGTLWRSKVDGSERMQLTYPPNQAMLPRWSPDGKRIVFFELPSDKPARVYEVSSEGGSARLLMPNDPSPQLDPNWSPDGTRVVFGGSGNDTASTIRILDLTNQQISTLPGSIGLYGPRWSPDGRYIVAQMHDGSALIRFDFRTQKWSELVKGTSGWLNWSKDGRYFYEMDYSGTGAVIKCRLSDGKTERVLDLKNIVTTGFYNSALAVAPDDSPLLLRDTGTSDVYALDWDEP
ncbi:MAG TPA: protein kinase [Candidatus Angelobacter sp.]|nr:protein kinase [Candidatus Angelobacter sp.]